VPRHGDPVEPALANGVDKWWRGVAALHGAVESTAVTTEPMSLNEDEPRD
jgi:hypothetical protein